MPEYLAPGVYIEETSYRSKSIEAVSTTTTGFVGPCRYGPIDLEPDIITSIGEFERVYGDRQQLMYGSVARHNYLWHAVRAFFEEGGKRLYIARVFHPTSGVYPPQNADFGSAQSAPNNGSTFPDDAARYDDGHARASVPDSGGENSIQIRARYPGAAGNILVRLTLRLRQNILGGTVGKKTLGALLENDVVWINDVTSPVASPPGFGTLYQAHLLYDAAKKENVWHFTRPGSDLTLEDLTPSRNPKESDNVRVVTLMVSAASTDGTGLTQVWQDLALDPGHTRNGVKDSVFDAFADKPANLSQARILSLVISAGSGVKTGLDVANVLFSAPGQLSDHLDNLTSLDPDRTIAVVLTGGNDGIRPFASDYEGMQSNETNSKSGLYAFEDIDDISIVAAPGSTFGYATEEYHDQAVTIITDLINHAERMKYRIAVLDSGDQLSIADVRAMRAQFDSPFAALYYPWIRILDPVTQQEINIPPSGSVAGIYARNDITRAVYKAPANEIVNVAIGFEQLLNKSQQDVLNPEGINCFRFFEGRGFRLWGARTISSDPEWKYVNLRRYFAYLEHSIDKGTQWAVFEPNGEALWANVQRTIADFLLNEWQMGALLGDKPEKAYFVRCDRTTMTQNDLDDGRLVCLIGVAALRPAEFVIFRIGQWTADRKV